MIVDTAATLFLEHSYERATMRSIGAAVGIDPATIYYYFSSKEALVVEILEAGVENLLTALQAALHNHEEPMEQFRAAVHAHVSHAVTGPYQALYDQVFSYLPEQAAAGVSAKRDLIDDTWRLIFDQLFEADLTTAKNPSLARLHVITAMNGIYRWYHPNGPATVDEIAEELVSLVGGKGGDAAARTPSKRSRR
jgi:AcrR family transcriptional regulator